MEGKGWAVMAVLIGIVIGANHKKLKGYLSKAFANLGSSFENMGPKLGGTWATVGGAAISGVQSTGQFFKGAYEQTLHLIPGEKGNLISHTRTRSGARRKTVGART